MSQAKRSILKLENISKVYHAGTMASGTKLKAVDNVNLSVSSGDIFGIVGESGCGKSTIAKMVAHLLAPSSGYIYLEDENIEPNSHAQLRALRMKIQMVFQDPYSSVNPKKTIRKSVLMPLESLLKMRRNEMNQKFEQMMELVGIPKRLYDAYPHELSGGQLQRVAIARALIVEPVILIADEPIAALDVSIQSQVLNLMNDLQRERGLTIVFISHDLRVVQQFTNRTAIMYLGNVMEIGDTTQIFEQPRHPYTKALIDSIPHLDSNEETSFKVLEGEVPSLYHVPKGCPFHTRCPFKTTRCQQEKPALNPLDTDQSRQIACHHPLELDKEVESIAH